MQPAQTRTCARVKLLLQAQLCQLQRRRRLLQARASIALQHHAAAGAWPAACLQQRVRGRASSRGQKGATRCTCIPAGTATWHRAQLCTRQPGTALRAQYVAHNQARAQPHNLNGHTAHAASKASRSQAYTLPLVALLSLLSASPTSSTPSPQFPSYWSASVKRAELSTCSRSTDEHRQADAQRPRTRARSMGNQPGGRQLAYNRRTGASRPGSHDGRCITKVRGLDSWGHRGGHTQTRHTAQLAP